MVIQLEWELLAQGREIADSDELSVAHAEGIRTKATHLGSRHVFVESIAGEYTIY